MNQRRRMLFASLILMGISAIVGCTPVSDGFTDGVADGLSAATSAFIEELANLVASGIVPDGGA